MTTQLALERVTSGLTAARAQSGVSPLAQTPSVSPVSDSQLASRVVSQMLSRMISKVRWCQALAFPMGEDVVEDAKFDLDALKARDKFRGTYSKVTEDVERTFMGAAKAISSEIGFAPFPPMILIFFGTWWKFRGYVKAVTVEWEAPWHPETVQPYGATVNLSLQPLMSGIPTHRKIRENTSAQDLPVVSGSVTYGAAAVANKARSATRNLTNLPSVAPPAAPSGGNFDPATGKLIGAP